jgi:NaMN:DMB phosphoribosyltransferase
MPYFLIERNFADRLEENRAGAAEINQINADSGVEWLISFLSADRKRTFCLYEAPSAEAIREAARRAGIPADEIIEVGELRRNGEMGPILPERFALSDPPG